MRAKLNAHEIYQFLIQKNFNLSSDKILKEPQQNADIIWNILIFLAFNIKDTKFQQIQPALSYLLDPQSHRNSLKRIKQYTILSDTFKKILKNNEQYPIRQILKPEKEALFQRLSILISANKFVEKIIKDTQPKRTQIKLKRQLVNQLRHKLQSRLQQAQQLKSLKQRQRTAYQQKTQSIENLTKQLTYKKKQKLDLLNSQQLLDNEQKKKIKATNQMGYFNDDLNIKIKQLERQVIRNAPKLKKQRFSLIDQYQNSLKTNKNQFDLWSHKIKTLQEKLKPLIGLKQKNKSFKIQQKFKQLEILVSQLSNLSKGLQNENHQRQQITKTKKQLLKQIQTMQKEKKQLNQSLNREQKQYMLLEKSMNMIKDEERVNSNNVKTLCQKNQQSIAQHKALQQKIKLRNQRFKAKVVQLNLRLASIAAQARNIIGDTFADFN